MKNSLENMPLEGFRRPLFRRAYAKKQRRAVWIWVAAPLLLVAGAIVASLFGPVEDGVELDPVSQAEVSSQP